MFPSGQFTRPILTWRWCQDKTFKLVPVAVPPVSINDLGKGRFEPHSLSELQGIRLEFTADEVQAFASDSHCWVDDVVRALDSLRHNSPDSSKADKRAAKLLEEKITALLGSPTLDLPLHRAAQLLGGHLRGWHPNLRKTQLLARLLLQADLPTACEALRDLDEIDIERRCQIRELLKPLWISFQAAQQILRVAKATSNRAFAINAERYITLRLYIKRACNRTEESEWPIMEVSTPKTQCPVDEVINNLRNSYIEKYGKSYKAQLDLIEKQLSDTQSNRPLFAMLEVEPSKEELTIMQKQLRRVTFCMRSRYSNAVGDEVSPSGACLLRPALKENEEDLAHSKILEAEEAFTKSTRYSEVVTLTRLPS